MITTKRGGKKKEGAEGCHDATPPHRYEVRKQAYRLSAEQRNELNKQLEELLENGFIESSVSPYGAPKLFVKKKSGQYSNTGYV
mmetsp:Transcript_1301/g.2641  ORF Transcript_1301/g.2641 Transcript_1301/m.2641 type:complete len:84 (+) Transcript_1301:286-537(+)